MRRIAVLLVLCGGLRAQSSPDVRAIESLVGQYLSAVDQADAAAFARVWETSPEATFIHPLGHERGWEQIKAFLENVFGKLMTDRHLTARDIRVRVVDRRMAVAEFYWNFTAKLRADGSPVKTAGRETQVYRRTKNGWRLIHVHYSGMPATELRRGL